MKKLILSVFLALILALTLSTAAFAGDGDVQVEVSDVTIEGTGVVGTGVTASGTVTITSEAESNIPFLLDIAEAMSSYGYTVTGPGVDLSGSGSTYDVDVSFFGPAEADASYVYNWSQSFIIGEAGTYTIDQFGEAFARAWAQFFLWPIGYWEGASSAMNSAILVCRAMPTWFNNGSFEVVITDITMSHYGYAFEDGTLLEEVDQIGYNGYNSTIRVVIPEGTEITGGNKLIVGYNPGPGVDQPFTFGPHPCSMTFSNPVTIYKLLAGGEVELISFTEIAGGYPVT